VIVLPDDVTVLDSSVVASDVTLTVWLAYSVVVVLLLAVVVVVL